MGRRRSRFGWRVGSMSWCERQASVECCNVTRATMTSLLFNFRKRVQTLTIRHTPDQTKACAQRHEIDRQPPPSRTLLEHIQRREPLLILRNSRRRLLLLSACSSFLIFSILALTAIRFGSITFSRFFLKYLLSALFLPRILFFSLPTFFGASCAAI